jgi:hypothetical protein
LPSRTLIDVQAWLELDEVFESDMFDGLKVTAGAMNLFGRNVDFAHVGNMVGYDFTQADMRERFAYARIVKTF